MRSTRPPGARPAHRERRIGAPTSRALMFGVTAGVIVTLAAIIFWTAPRLLLGLNGQLTDEDLARVSNAGQAYGGLSALLSGLATGAVAIALILQVRQIRMSQAQGVRMVQIELMSLLIQNPELRPVSPTLGDVNTAQRLRDVYTNLILRYLEMGYEIGYFPAQSVRTELRSQFAVQDIRRFWERTRPIQRAGIMNRSQRRFNELVDEAYAQASAATSASPVAAAPKPAVHPRPRRRLTGVAAAGAVLAVVMCRAWQARRGR